MARRNHRTTLPQSALRAAGSLREGAGNGLHHSTGYSLKSNVSGDFHRPYETQKSLHFTIHRTTLPQSRPCGRASSLREGAGRGCTIHPSVRKSQHCGRFSSPLRNSKEFTFYHSTDYTLSELVAMLQGQQFRLPGNSTGVSGQISICTNDPVAWDDDGYRIVTNGTAHRLSGKLRN